MLGGARKRHWRSLYMDFLRLWQVMLLWQSRNYICQKYHTWTSIYYTLTSQASALGLMRLNYYIMTETWLGPIKYSLVLAGMDKDCKCKDPTKCTRTRTTFLSTSAQGSACFWSYSEQIFGHKPTHGVTRQAHWNELQPPFRIAHFTGQSWRWF